MRRDAAILVALPVLLLTSCTRTVIRPLPEGPTRAIGRLNVAPLETTMGDSVRVRLIDPAANPVAGAKLFLARDAATLVLVEPESGFSLPPGSRRLHLQGRSLAFGQLDTIILADRVRGRRIDVQFLGHISTAPMVLVERVPWWKFWIR